MKGVTAILLVEASGAVAAVAGDDPGDAIAAAAARFLRDSGTSTPLQEVLATTSDRYWLARPVGSGGHFLLLVLDRHRANLARTQLDLVAIERILGERL